MTKKNMLNEFITGVKPNGDPKTETKEGSIIYPIPTKPSATTQYIPGDPTPQTTNPATTPTHTPTNQNLDK